MSDPVIPAGTDGATAARRMWTLFETVHVISYFGPHALGAFEAAGLRGFWRGYFAGRAAPLGAASAPLVAATFFSFSPSFVARAVPAVCELISPAEALAVRQAGVTADLRERLGRGACEPPGADVRRAADLLLEAAAVLDGAWRPLGGPNAARPVPAEPLARLWHAATVLREHRGDGHIAALVAAGIDGCEALVLRCAVDPAGVDRARLQAVRGWTDEEWDAAAGRLAGRGWLDAGGTSAGGGAATAGGAAATGAAATGAAAAGEVAAGPAATAAGRAAHQAIEAATDVAAARPWARLGPGRTAELAGLLGPAARACATMLPYPNPVGVPPPAS